MGGGRRGERGRAQVRGVVGPGFGGPGPWGVWFVGPKVNRLAWAALPSSAWEPPSCRGRPGFCRRCSKATTRGEKGNEDIRRSDDIRRTAGDRRAGARLRWDEPQWAGAGGARWVCTESHIEPNKMHTTMIHSKTNPELIKYGGACTLPSIQVAARIIRMRTCRSPAQPLWLNASCYSHKQFLDPRELYPTCWYLVFLQDSDPMVYCCV